MGYYEHDCFCSAFRKLLLHTRRHLLITQDQLSQQVGITRQFISMIESGKRIPSFETFCELAHGLGISPTELVSLFETLYEKELSALKNCTQEKSMAMEYILNTAGGRSSG